jgi:hemoglobin/transferrin/lactoferrin receptor protein
VKYFIFGYLGILTFTAQAQVLKVIDRESGTPLPLVTIVSETPALFATTDEQGEADITDFAEVEAIEIRYLGYTTLITSFNNLEKHGFVVRLFPSGLSVNGIVVTATRIGQHSGDIPHQVLTLSRREVALQNPQTTADLLGTSGKVFIQKSQQGGGSPMIRGFAANRLLYTIDGVRMNTAIFRGGNLQNVISLDPFSIEKTDVYFGPGSVIYGSDAVGGVMSFQTLTPRLSGEKKTVVNGQVLGRYATANQEKTGHIHLNLGANKWASLTSISGNDYGDLKVGKNGPDDYLRPFYVEHIDGEDVKIKNKDPLVQVPSGYQQLNLMQKIRFRPDDHWDFNYGFHRSATTDFSRYDRHLRQRQGEPRYGEWSYGPQKWRMHLLQVDHHTNRTLFDKIAVRLAWQQFEESRHERDFQDHLRYVRKDKVAAYSFNLDLMKTIDDKHKLFYGLEGVLDQVTSDGAVEEIISGEEFPGPSRYPQADWSSLGLYFTWQQQLSDEFTWQSGMRYSHYQLGADFDTTFYPFPFTEATIDKGSLTGSAGLVYRPSSDWVVMGNFATGFRAPNVDDIGKVFDSEPGAVVVPNPRLAAEYAYNIELGAAWVIRGNLKIDLALYYTLLDNAMVRRNYTLNGQDSIVYNGESSRVQAIQNAARAKVYGLQTGMELRLPAGFIFASNLNVQNGEEELDNGSISPSRHAAPNFGISRLTWSGERFKTQLYVVYSAGVDFTDLAQEERGKPEIYAQDAKGHPYAPAWYTLNLKASWEISPVVSLNLGWENITNQRYRPYSSGIAAAGGNFIVSLQASI